MTLTAAQLAHISTSAAFTILLHDLRKRKHVEDKVEKFVTDLVDSVKRGTTNQRELVQIIVNQAAKKYPRFNWVACHTAYETCFDGRQGKNWGHSHHEVKLAHWDCELESIGIVIYWFESGALKVKEDSESLKCAYFGNISSQSTDRKWIVFRKRL